MKIIKTNEMLRRYVPNVLREVAGETNLFDKVYPALASAEEWLEDEIVGEKMMDVLSEADESNRLYLTAARVVACKAMADAVPMLDLILTPNGFGVVSNANIAPASKERVDRLISSLSSLWERLAADLLDRLRGEKEWQRSAQQMRWAKLLLSPAELATYVPNTLPISTYAERRAEMAAIEDAIADEFLGSEYFQALHDEWWSDNVPTDDLRIVNDAINAITQSLKAGAPRLGALVPTVDLIRNNPDDYPLWHATTISKVYSHEPFSNNKKNHGYFL